MHHPPQIGANIMHYRKINNISLNELSKRSGVSKSMLSQIEQEKTNPTVITVWKIARSLGIAMEELIESKENASIEVLRCNDTPVIYSEDKLCTIKINSPIHMTDNLELYHMRLKPGGKNSSMAHFANAEEFLTVISGQLKITAGSHSSVLNTGDTARYRADQEHCIENIVDQDTEAYLVVWFPK